MKYHKSETENSQSSLTGVENGTRVCVTVFFFDAMKFPLSYHERRFPEIFNPQAPKILSLKQRFQKAPRFLYKKALPRTSFSDVDDNTLFSC